MQGSAQPTQFADTTELQAQIQLAKESVQSKLDARQQHADLLKRQQEDAAKQLTGLLEIRSVVQELEGRRLRMAQEERRFHLMEQASAAEITRLQAQLQILYERQQILQVCLFTNTVVLPCFCFSIIGDYLNSCCLSVCVFLFIQLCLHTGGVGISNAHSVASDKFTYDCVWCQLFGTHPISKLSQLKPKTNQQYCTPPWFNSSDHHQPA